MCDLLARRKQTCCLPSPQASFCAPRPSPSFISSPSLSLSAAGATARVVSLSISVRICLVVCLCLLHNSGERFVLLNLVMVLVIAVRQHVFRGRAKKCCHTYILHLWNTENIRSSVNSHTSVLSFTQGWCFRTLPPAAAHIWIYPCKRCSGLGCGWLDA